MSAARGNFRVKSASRERYIKMNHWKKETSYNSAPVHLDIFSKYFYWTPSLQPVRPQIHYSECNIPGQFILISLKT
jgi:hypothetical protein